MSTKLRYQVLEYQPELTHSVWVEFLSRRRSNEAAIKELRKLVKTGEYVGYRVVTVHEEYIGCTWPTNTKL